MPDFSISFNKFNTILQANYMYPIELDKIEDLKTKKDWLEADKIEGIKQKDIENFHKAFDEILKYSEAIDSKLIGGVALSNDGDISRLELMSLARKHHTSNSEDDYIFTPEDFESLQKDLNRDANLLEIGEIEAILTENGLDINTVDFKTLDISQIKKLPNEINSWKKEGLAQVLSFVKTYADEIDQSNHNDLDYGTGYFFGSGNSDGKIDVEELRNISYTISNSITSAKKGTHYRLEIPDLPLNANKYFSEKSDQFYNFKDLQVNPTFKPFGKHGHALAKDWRSYFKDDNGKYYKVFIPKGAITDGITVSRWTKTLHPKIDNDAPLLNVGLVHDVLNDYLDNPGNYPVPPTIHTLKKGSSNEWVETPISAKYADKLANIMIGELNIKEKDLLKLQKKSEKLLKKNVSNRAKNKLQQLQKAYKNQPAFQQPIVEKNGNYYQLVEDYQQEATVNGVRYQITVPAYERDFTKKQKVMLPWRSDGASVPPPFKLLGFKNDGDMVGPAIIHDWLYGESPNVIDMAYYGNVVKTWDETTQSWQPVKEPLKRSTADKIFYELLKESGTSSSFLYYLATRFTWNSWKDIGETNQVIIDQKGKY